MHISTDIGGTFTDFVIFDDNNDLTTFKTQSTPTNPEHAIKNGLAKYFKLQPRPASRSSPIFSHGTTVATNTVIERKGAHAAMVTTKGFSDILEIGRQSRPSLYDFKVTRPPPLVLRSLSFELEERIAADGKIIRKISHPEIDKLIKKINRLNRTKYKDQPIETIAINFLFSFLNPAHEQKVAARFRKSSNVIPVLSSEVLPEFREYERFSTTVLEAYLRHKIGDYLQNLETVLRKYKITEFYLMQSNGGVTTAKSAGNRSINTLLSGPAAGVAAAKYIGDKLDLKNYITFDMGGTSTDVSTIIDGNMKWTSESNIEGLPLSIPILDIVTIGAGGGSITWMDKGGALRVGPESSGAVPGPICYARGGNDVTVTDCDLLTGFINPDYFLDGEMTLDHELTKKLTRKFVNKISLKFEDTVAGVIKVVNSNMIRALWKVSVERGYDPQDFSMVAFGGAGPVHAAALARELNIPHVVIPPGPGVFSAFGMMVTDVRADYSKTVILSTTSSNVGKLIDQELKQLMKKAKNDHKGQKRSTGHPKFIPSIDLRYKGQSYEINIDYKNNMTQLLKSFHATHSQRYGYCSHDREVEIVGIRLTAITNRKKPEIVKRRRKINKASGIRKEKALEYRQILFDLANRWVKTPIYRRSELQFGFSGEGPAVIEEPSSTVVVYPGMKFNVDQFGIIHIMT
jgi:N-methylhydantoinase A